MNVPHKQVKQLIVVEGQSGVGKTTLTQALERELGAPVVRLKWRHQADEAPGSLSSLALDLERANRVNELFDQGHSVVILERWIMSQAVYGHLRRGETDFKPSELLSYPVGQLGQHLLGIARFERWFRLGDIAEHADYEVDILWAVMLPPLDLIRQRREERRRQGNRGDFPFNAEEEYYLYARLVQSSTHLYHSRTIPLIHPEVPENIAEILKWVIA